MITITPPGIRISVPDDTGNGAWRPAAIPFSSYEVDDSESFIDIQGIVPATDTTGFYFDAFTGVGSGCTAGGFYKKDQLDWSITSTRLLIITAQRKASATADLVSNYIQVSFDNVLVGTIGVNDAGKVSPVILAYAGPYEAPFVLSGMGGNITAGAITAADDVYTKTAHGLYTGQRVNLVSLTGGTGLVAGTNYYFHKLTDNTGKLCATYANAGTGTAVNVTVDASSVVLAPSKSGIKFGMDTTDNNIEFRVICAGTN